MKKLMLFSFVFCAIFSSTANEEFTLRKGAYNIVIPVTECYVPHVSFPDNWLVKSIQYQQNTDYFYNIWNEKANYYLGNVSYRPMYMNTEKFGSMISHYVSAKTTADNLYLGGVFLSQSILDAYPFYQQFSEQSASSVRLNARLMYLGLFLDESMLSTVDYLSAWSSKYNASLEGVARFIVTLGECYEDNSIPYYRHSYLDIMRIAKVEENDMLAGLAMLRSGLLSISLQSDLQYYNHL